MGVLRHVENRALGGFEVGKELSGPRTDMRVKKRFLLIQIAGFAVIAMNRDLPCSLEPSRYDLRA